MKFADFCILCAVAFGIAACGRPEKASPAASQPMTCKIDLASEEGGRLEVLKAEPDPRLPMQLPPLQIFWHPPALGSSVDLAVSYHGSSLEKLGSPSGGHARFTNIEGPDGKDYEALVTSGGKQVWRFDSDIDIGAEFGAVELSGNHSGGAAVMEAIERGDHIRIAISKGSKKLASATFDTSATAGRDKLLAQARQLVATEAPKVCWRPSPNWPL